MAQGYDPAKAALFNKLIQDGIGEDAALAQAGITDADFGNYELKTTQPGKKISIGTMPDSEFDHIKRETTHRFESSDP